MATRIVFNDDDNNEMECYLNAHGKVYIGINQPEIEFSGYITLEKDDVQTLIGVLQEIEKVM